MESKVKWQIVSAILIVVLIAGGLFTCNHITNLIDQVHELESSNWALDQSYQLLLEEHNSLETNYNSLQTDYAELLNDYAELLKACR